MGINYIGKCLLVEGEKKILVVGDLHLGYEEALNASGISIMRHLFKEDLEYFDKLFDKIGDVDEVVLLGDVKHLFGGILKQEWEEVLELFDYLKEKTGKVIWVRGNHDKIFEPLAKEGIDVGDYYLVDGYCFLHGDRDFPEIHSKKVNTWVIGHGHPAVKISDGVKIEKYKCFLDGRFEGKQIIIVPSFFEGNAGSDPRENDLGLVWDFNFNKFYVKVVGEKLEVLDFGKLGKLK